MGCCKGEKCHSVLCQQDVGQVAHVTYVKHFYWHPQHTKAAHHSLKEIRTDSETAARKTARNLGRGLEKQDL